MALCVIDKRVHGEVKEKLSRFADVIEFHTVGATYEAISGHADIFLCKTGNKLIVSPNVAGDFLSAFDKRNIKYESGSTFIQMEYPQSAAYCAVFNEDYLIHRTDITDKTILESAEYHEIISVQQGYSRCNLLALINNNFITSDNGIFKKLSAMKFNVLYVDSSEILLPGFSHGFFGGACGVYEDMVFIAGNLNYFSDGETVRKYLGNLKYRIIELYNGPLLDCGGILFI